MSRSQLVHAANILHREAVRVGGKNSYNRPLIISCQNRSKQDLAMGQSFPSSALEHQSLGNYKILLFIPNCCKACPSPVSLRPCWSSYPGDQSLGQWSGQWLEILFTPSSSYLHGPQGFFGTPACLASACMDGCKSLGDGKHAPCQT